MKVTRCLFVFLALILVFISQVFADEKSTDKKPLPDPQIIYAEKGAVYVTPLGEVFACRYYSQLEALMGFKTDRINIATCVSPNREADWQSLTHRWDRENKKEFHGYVDSQGNRYECLLVREICEQEKKFNDKFFSDEFCVDYSKCVKTQDAPPLEVEEPCMGGEVFEVIDKDETPPPGNLNPGTR